MKTLKIVGKTSLIKNFILRNNIVEEVEKSRKSERTIQLDKFSEFSNNTKRS